MKLIVTIIPKSLLDWFRLQDDAQIRPWQKDNTIDLFLLGVAMRVVAEKFVS